MEVNMTKQCQICSSIFTKPSTCSAKRWNEVRRYCSLKCKGIATRGRAPWNDQRITKSCLVCTNDFKVSPTFKHSKYCSRKCYGSTLHGENAINWQGGITPINAAIRNSEKYSQWRTAVFKRDDYTCQNCNERGGKLEADHIKLFSRYPELRLTVDNGQTLCKPCHKLKTNIDLKRHWKNQFSSSFIKSLN